MSTATISEAPLIALFGSKGAYRVLTYLENYGRGDVLPRERLAERCQDIDPKAPMRGHILDRGLPEVAAWRAAGAMSLTWPNDMATMSCMKKVKIGEFRDRASEMIRRAAGGETIVILNRDREVAKLVPLAAPAEGASRLLGCLAGTAEVRGDIEAPIAPPESWFQSRS